MKKPRVLVSDHALVRFLERVGGVDMPALRLAIGRSLDEAARLGAQGVIIDGFRYVLAENDHGIVLVTVEPQHQANPVRRSGRRREREQSGGGEA